MSALGQKQTSDQRPLMSALPPKADIARRQLDVRFVPQADIRRLVIYWIESSAFWIVGVRLPSYVVTFTATQN
jgi:hypothetical protein